MKAFLRRLRRVLGTQRGDDGGGCRDNWQPSGHIAVQAANDTGGLPGVAVVSPGSLSLDSFRAGRIRCISEPCANTHVAAGALRSASRFPMRSSRPGRKR